MDGNFTSKTGQAFILKENFIFIVVGVKWTNSGSKKSHRTSSCIHYIFWSFRINEFIVGCFEYTVLLKGLPHGMSCVTFIASIAAWSARERAL